MPPTTKPIVPTIESLMLLCKENAEWLLGRENLKIVMTRIGNMDNLPYMAVVVAVGDPSVKIMSEPRLTELEALRDLFEELGKQVGHKLKEEDVEGVWE